MNSRSFVHAGRVVINSICDGVGFIESPTPQPHANASFPHLLEMNSIAGITLFASVLAQPSPYRYEEWPATIIPFDGDGSPICFSDGALIFFVSIPANPVADF